MALKLPAELFERIDNAPDSEFYLMPRLVNHIDDETIAALTQFYSEKLKPGSEILDLMSSWVSHLPSNSRFSRVSGLGMNEVELAANPVLNDYVVKDLNQDPSLPFEDHSFDHALIAVSIQYLISPLSVFREIARVLRPGGGLFVAMSHRCFPTKAIRVFHHATMAERGRLVQHYFTQIAEFGECVIVDRSPANADPLVIVHASTIEKL